MTRPIKVPCYLCRLHVKCSLNTSSFYVLGFDPIYFGVVLTLNIMIGTLTPPVGLVLYITAHIAELPLSKAIREILPFYIPLVISLIIIMFFPWITMVLPNLLMK